MENTIMIIGHKNPDTDSICSAISYAYLKNQLIAEHKVPLTENGLFPTEVQPTYVPMRAGNINNETAYVLDYFHVDVPNYIDDVNTQVADIEYRKTKGISSHISIKNAWKLMRENDVVTLPIVTKDNILEGLITINDIAKSYMDVTEPSLLSEAKTPYENLLDILGGTLIVGNPHNHFVNGKVLIGAANPHLMEDYIEKDDIVILGDRIEAQLTAIEKGASCLIVCLDTQVNPAVIHMAEQAECSIITTPLDTYSVARLINQSVPVKHFMRSQHLITFQLDDTVDSIKEIMSKKRHRDFPVVDDYGNYYGMVSRRNLLALRKKKLIMVDHNEKNQAVNGIENAELLEVIDHHRIGSMETISPVYFRNQPVGCTATIINQMFEEQSVYMPKNIAGLLCAAILSDTLVFRSPTCTTLDKSTAEKLAKIAEIDLEKFSMDMFEAGSTLSGKTPEALFTQDFKAFNVEDITIGVSQISSINQNELDKLAVTMSEYIESHLPSMAYKMVFFMLTNILEEKTTLLCFGPDSAALANEAFGIEGDGHTFILPNVVSRKKQVVPVLVTALQRRL